MYGFYSPNYMNLVLKEHPKITSNRDAAIKQPSLPAVPCKLNSDLDVKKLNFMTFLLTNYLNLGPKETPQEKHPAEVQASESQVSLLYLQARR